MTWPVANVGWPKAGQECLEEEPGNFNKAIIERVVSINVNRHDVTGFPANNQNKLV